MKKVTSVSGGKTSAYIAANYEQDYLVFALVRTEDTRLRFKDTGVVKIVEDKIQADFIGTLEYDTIIYTMLDLEQYLGKKIHWVTGTTFEQVIKGSGGYLPNKATRFCTTEMKLRPIFNWWFNNFNEPVDMNIGYRYTERDRKDRMIKAYNENGLHEFKETFDKHRKGRHKGLNKWCNIQWRKCSFPLIDDVVYKDEIESFWDDKPVRFAKLNNCVGCFNRGAPLLNFMSKDQPEKFDWFIEQEQKTRNYWKDKISYEKIRDSEFTAFIDFDFDGCDSGFCGM